MFKLFTLISSIGLLSSPIATIKQTKLITNYENLNKLDVNTWDEVGISHKQSLPASGTHDKNNKQDVNYATARINWNNTISKSESIRANGLFELHSYKNPKTYSQMYLTLNEDLSVGNYRIWEGNAYNHESTGWGHQKEWINLTLTATYNEKEAITSLHLNSYIRARTVSSVHTSYVTSTIDEIIFLV